MAKRKKKQPTAGNVMVIMGIAALMGLAVREQLQMPPEERTWHGTLYGIPYDFRRPTIERLREAFWNKDTARVLVPQAFGMGWSINFYPLIHTQAAEHMPETPVTK
jgi:uncharacterized membrane protein